MNFETPSGNRIAGKVGSVMNDNPVPTSAFGRQVHPSGRSGRQGRGQALVEMAIVLPLLLLFAAIALDYSRLYFDFQSVESAATAGAQYGCSSVVAASNSAMIRSNALAQAYDILRLSPSVTNSFNGSNISVTVTAVFTPTVRWPVRWWSPLATNVVLRRTVNMRILQ